MKRPLSKFQAPNHTQTPNDFFDLIADMDGSELKVTLIMIRETFGWHRKGFKMGINKLAARAGLSRNGAKAGAAAAEERGTFRRANPDSMDEAEWELVVEEPGPDEPDPDPLPDDDPGDGQPLTTPSTVDHPDSQPVTMTPQAGQSKIDIPPLELKKEKEKRGNPLAKPDVDPRWNFSTMGDYTDYPQDVWEYLIEFCVCFNFSAPSVPRKKGTLKESSRAGLWINELRELKDACRPIGPLAIRYYRFRFEEYMLEHDPHVGPIEVSKPGSIKNGVAGLVARIQSGEYTPLKESPLAQFKAGTYHPQVKNQNGQPDQAPAMVNKKF